MNNGIKLLNLKNELIIHYLNLDAVISKTKRQVCQQVRSIIHAVAAE
jgi:hypothetical protein